MRSAKFGVGSWECGRAERLVNGPEMHFADYLQALNVWAPPQRGDRRVATIDSSRSHGSAPALW